MDDDPVVNEIDIFNCSEIGRKSFLLQFPLVSCESQVPAVQFAAHNEKDQYEFVVLPQQDLFSTTETTYNATTQEIKLSQPLAIGVLHNNQLHLTPVYKVLQARPTPSANQDETEKNYDINWTRIQDLEEFISASVDDISAPMSAQMYQKMLAGSQESVNIENIENLNDSELHSRPPSEQLIYILVKDKTIRFDEQLQKHGLQAYKEELLSVLLEYAFYIQGRWTIKPEKLPESIYPFNLRMARNFIIVLFANKKPLPVSKINAFYNLFNVKKDDMSKILENLGVKLVGGDQIVFKFRENNQFESLHKEYADQGKEEIDSLKEGICIAKHDEHLFDIFLD